MAQIVIFGAGDIARLAHIYFSRDSEHEVVAFTVDREYLPGGQGEEFRGLPLVGFDEVTRLYPPDRFQMFVALSYNRMNRVRAAKYEAARGLGYRLVSYVSSRCTFLTDHPVGDNCFILEDNTIQPEVRIGNDVTLWSGNHIGHDAVIEDHCFIASHVVVSGHVRIGSYCFIGVNVTLRNSIAIAPRTLLGAGAVILGDTVEGGVYVPQRARLLENKTSDDIDL
ncbi:MAG TPA: acetyltransferase [Thermoanaerobaculia bacterium]|nr:acetyltransferase [Thermoanaerobaculia bacterium]